MITRENLEQFNRLQDEIHSRMSYVGKAYYEIVNGSVMGNRRLSYYYDAHDHNTDTDVVSIYFEASTQGGTEEEIVRVPFSYLENDEWQEPLRVKLEQDRATEAQRQQEAAERATLAKLQAKYGETDDDARVAAELAELAKRTERQRLEAEERATFAALQAKYG